MNIAKFSIQRPILVSSLVLLSVITGWISLTRLGVDIFPDVNIPVVIVNTIYTGAGPEEMENLISRPLEEELSSISGMKRLRSISQEGYSSVIAEFNLDVDSKWAEQEVRTRVSRARRALPQGIEEPLILRIDPADQPILRLSLTADLPPAELYDLANEFIKPRFEQVQNVGSVKILGGTRREVQIELDRNKLNTYDIPAVVISKALQNYGANVPVGKFDSGEKELSFRSVGRFEKLSQVENVAVLFAGDPNNTLRLKNLGTVQDGTQDRTSIAELYAPVITRTKEIAPKNSGFLSGLFGGNKSQETRKVARETRPALFIDVYKQSKTNTMSVAEGAMKRMGKINEELREKKGHPTLTLVRDGARPIQLNVEDVTEAILIGILLTVIVVYFFLGNPRSTLITGLAIPNSMLGAFILMYIMGFTVNVITLLALSLTVGLLVDDAIVVRENIFRKLEEGLHPVEAAMRGTNEVALAVFATTATVIAVFLPVGFLGGMVGQFLSQLGFTVVFAMLVSFFDAMMVAPLLSAYFAGKMGHKPNILIRGFDRFQTWIEEIYTVVMRFGLKYPLAILLLTIVIFFGSLFSLKFVKKTFMGQSDFGEFMISLSLPPGTSLDGTYAVAKEVQKMVTANVSELDKMSIVVGSEQGESNVATLGVMLLDTKHRHRTTSDVKEQVRKLLKKYDYARPSVNDYSLVGGGVQYPFNMLIKGEDLNQLEQYANQVMDQIRKEVPDLIDVDTDYRSGKPEFQVRLDPIRMQAVGVAPATAGYELRLHVAGDKVGKFYANGLEYDIRMRLKPEQRNLRAAYDTTRIPNMGMPFPRMIPLRAISTGVETVGPQRIERQDRSRVIVVHANLAPTGAIGNATDVVHQIVEKRIKPPAGVSVSFVGQSEDLKELMQNILLAFGLALLFIYLVLSSLYESFITPVTILVAIPPAISGAFFGLAIMNEMLNIFSMIGVIMLMGLVTKNSILLVDYAMEGIRAGLPRDEAIFNAGRIRLRPILMTSFAMIAGTIPIAIGLNEASRARTAMGVAIIGGLIVSTVITLVVVPAIFGYIDRFRVWVETPFRPDYDMALLDKLNTSQEMGEDLRHVHGRDHK